MKIHSSKFDVNEVHSSQLDVDLPCRGVERKSLFYSHGLLQPVRAGASGRNVGFLTQLDIHCPRRIAYASDANREQS